MGNYPLYNFSYAVATYSVRTKWITASYISPHVTTLITYWWLMVRHTSEMRQAVTVACVVCIIRYFLLFVSRCYRFVRRTWELIFVFTSIAKFLKSTRLSDWPVMGVSEHWPWSFRLPTAPLATWSITLVKVWTASVLWCQGHWRSFRMMRLLPF